MAQKSHGLLDGLSDVEIITKGGSLLRVNLELQTLKMRDLHSEMKS